MLFIETFDWRFHMACEIKIRSEMGERTQGERLFGTQPKITNVLLTKNSLVFIYGFMRDIIYSFNALTKEDITCKIIH